MKPYQRISYSKFLAEKMELWASKGITSDNWDRLLIAILPVLIRELRKAQAEKKVELQKLINQNNANKIKGSKS